MINFRFLKTIAILSTASALCVAFAYALSLPRDPKVAPEPALPEAYAKAIEALGPEAKTFYCLRADAYGLYETRGPTEWHFSFHSADGSYREVIVSTRDKIVVRDHGVVP